MRKEVLRLESISKKINEVKVLKNISMTVYEGEIVKLFGDEGQSEAMIVRLLGGVFQPEFGKIYVDGKEANITCPHDGKKLGISIIHKRSDLIPNLSVLDNLFLGRNDPNSKPFLKEKQQLARARELLNILGLDISPQMLASTLTMEQVQMVQLGKALLDDPKVVVMDHTNILLDRSQIKLFEGVFRELSKRKVGILIVAQNLLDFSEISDRLYIIKDGSIIGNFNKPESEKEEIVRTVVEDQFIRRSKISLNDISSEVLRVEGLSTKHALKDVSFSVKKGEIVSITGSYGSGKCDIGYAIYGIEKITGGKIYIDEKRAKIKNPSDAIKNKIGLISFEHEENGLLYNLSVKENISILRLKNLSHLRIIKKELEDWLVKTVNSDIGFDFTDETISMEGLSVADQRKVIFARVMCSFPKILILVDPTKGLDDISRQQILELLVSFSNRGVSIILISSNIHEILQISNRVLLFRNNTITGVINEGELEYKDQFDIQHDLM
jgi:ribose transport system ATP-binding protein